MRPIDADALENELGASEYDIYAKECLREAPTIEVPRWIPVTELLPEEEELVLIICKNGARFVGYCGKRYGDFERRWRIKTALNSTKLLNLGRVTHWMPLPTPPKDGDSK